MLQSREILVNAFHRGYRVSKTGLLLGLNKLPRKLNRDTQGYLNCTIRISSGLCTRLHVHRLQAYQKYGNRVFKEGIVIRHKDGNPLNNNWKNILIGTQSDNMMDIPKEKRIINASNPIHNHEAILKDRELGLTYKELMKKYDISSKGTISFIINKSLIAV